jgi:hypothetical protein
MSDMKASYFVIPMLTTAIALLLWSAGDYIAGWLATTPIDRLLAWK